jgi:hypothetical protein
MTSPKSHLLFSDKLIPEASQVYSKTHLSYFDSPEAGSDWLVFPSSGEKEPQMFRNEKREQICSLLTG